MGQKIRKINCRCTKRRVTRNKELLGEEEKMNSHLRNFASYEISQVAKIRRTQNFENSQVKFDSPWNTCNKTRKKIIIN